MNKIKITLALLLIAVIILPSATLAYGGGVPPIFGPGFHDKHEPKTPKIKKEFREIIDRLGNFEERIHSKFKQLFSFFR